MKGIIGANGIGTSKKSYNQKKMFDRIGLPYKIFNHQQFIEIESNELKGIHTSYGSKTARKSRGILYDSAFDETAYWRNRDIILPELRKFIKESGFTEVVFIGHSWGAVIMYDFIKNFELDGIKITHLITTGCPVLLRFGLNIKEVSPVKWFNFWEKNDGVAHKMFAAGCEDVEFRSRNWLYSWNLFSHASYKKSKQLSKDIKELIR